MLVEVEHRDYRDTLKRCAELGGARLIVTSPPYLDSRARGQYGFDCPAWTEADYDALGEAVIAGLMPGGVCALNIFGRVAKWRKGPYGTERSTTWMKVALRWQEMGLRYLECYAYRVLSNPGTFGPRHRKGWEPVHIFAKPGAGPLFNAWVVTRPSLHKGHKKGAARVRHVSGWTPSGPGFVTGERSQCDTVVDVGVVAGNTGETDLGHPAPFARTLADFFVLSYSAPGDLVCDPFTGSGTVAISAAKHGRAFVGGDLGERLEDVERGRTRARWADVSRERALASQAQHARDALDGATARVAQDDACIVVDGGCEAAAIEPAGQGAGLFSHVVSVSSGVGEQVDEVIEGGLRIHGN